MITFKKFGKTIKIRNNDWKKLKERFDARKAYWDGEQYLILTSCPLCDRYFTRCAECPFWAFKQYGVGSVACVDFLEKLFKRMYLNPGTDGLSWSRHANKLARKQLGQILKMMDKIEASQGGKNDKESKD